jgi:hypothetical protein
MRRTHQDHPTPIDFFLWDAVKPWWATLSPNSQHHVKKKEVAQLKIKKNILK